MSKVIPKLFYIVMIVFFLFSTLNVASEDRLKRCIDAIEQGNLSIAISCLREAVRKDKKNSEGYIWLGTALLKADSADGAVAPLVQARELDPNNLRIYVLLGDAYMKQNIYGAAVQQYQQAIQLDSNKVECYVKLADAYKKNRQYNEAARAYTRAIVLDTTNIDVIRELGTIYFRANQYANAVPLLERVTRYQPDSLHVQIQFAKALYHIKAYERFIPVAERILQKDSSQTEIFNMLGESYFETKDCENADKILSRTHSDSLKAEDFIKLGKVKKCLDKFDEAITMYENAYRSDSTLEEIYYDLGTLYMKKKMWQNAIEMFQKKLSSDTSSGYQFAVNLNMGLCLMQTKEFAKARKHILASIELRPDYIQAWSSLAACYAQMDSTGPQRDAYRKIIDLIKSSNNGNGEKYKDQLEEAYRMEGFFFLLDKKYQSSVEYLKKALQLDPKNSTTLLWIAQSYHNNNNRDEAKRYYCKVLDMSPKNKDADKGLKLLGFEPSDCNK